MNTDKTTGQALVMLIHSRKFLVAMLDLIVSLILFFVTKYGSPAQLQDVTILIGAFQVPVGLVIGAIAWDNATEAKERTEQAKLSSINPERTGT